jgi:hypothetical protein
MIWVATECSRHNLVVFPGMFDSGTASQLREVGRGPILLQNHIVHIQLWNKEVLQHIEIHVTRYGRLGGKVWSVNLCSAYSIKRNQLRTVSHMFDNLVWILWCPDD